MSGRATRRRRTAGSRSRDRPSRAPRVAEDDQPPGVVVADREHRVAAAQRIAPRRHRHHAGAPHLRGSSCSGARRAPCTNGKPSARQARSCDDRAPDPIVGDRAMASCDAWKQCGVGGRRKRRTRYGHIGSGQAPILEIVRIAVAQRHRAVRADHAGQHALVVVDEQSRRRRHVRTPLPEFVVAQRRGDRVRRAAVQVKLVVDRRAMATEIDDSGEPTHDRGVRTVLPVQRAHAVPTGAEMPFHL